MDIDTTLKVLNTVVFGYLKELPHRSAHYTKSYTKLAQTSYISRSHQDLAITRNCQLLRDERETEPPTRVNWVLLLNITS